MSNETLMQLQEGLTTAYIDGTSAANLAYKRKRQILRLG